MTNDILIILLGLMAFVEVILVVVTGYFSWKTYVQSKVMTDCHRDISLIRRDIFKANGVIETLKSNVAEHGDKIANLEEEVY